MADNVVTIRVIPDDLTIQARTGETLADVLVRSGIPLAFYCQGKGICGKCFVRIVSGPLPLLEADERAILEKRSLSKDHRLACRYTIFAPAVVEIIPDSRASGIFVLESGLSRPITLDPAVKCYTISLPAPSLSSPHAWIDDIKEVLKVPGLEIPVSSIRPFLDSNRNSRTGLMVTLYQDKEVLSVEPGGTPEAAYGLAVDVGTSTVVIELVNLISGETVGRAAAPNSQIVYGADVVSRIAFAFQNPDNLNRLRESILQLLNSLISEAVSKAGIRRDLIYEAVIAGNTAMNHIFCGVAVDTLALSPFSAVFSTLSPFPAAELGLGLHPRAQVYVVPNIRSFVGGDITAGLLAADLQEENGNAIFIDLGTNGEIVVKKGRSFFATSTAAGPAFEGMSISCGMLAVPGAVHNVRWSDGFVLQTLGTRPPQGLCGTGLNDLVALSLSHGLIGPDGKIKSTDKKILFSESLAITQQDIREVQLAVAAIKTGLRMMLRESNLSLKKIDRLCIAGAFGNFLDIDNARILGLVPDVPKDVVEFVGNSSLAGARKLLLSAPSRTLAEDLAARVEHLSLATRPGFQEEFMMGLAFGP